MANGNGSRRLNGWWKTVVLAAGLTTMTTLAWQLRAADVGHLSAQIDSADARAMRNTARFERIDSTLRVQAELRAAQCVRDSVYRADQQRVNEWVVKSIDQMMQWQGIPPWHREPLPIDTVADTT